MDASAAREHLEQGGAVFLTAIRPMILLIGCMLLAGSIDISEQMSIEGPTFA